MPKDRISYYNRIDIGIFLCFLELCLQYEKLAFERKLYTDDNETEEMVLNAEYRLFRGDE